MVRTVIHSHQVHHVVNDTEAAYIHLVKLQCLHTVKIGGILVGVRQPHLHALPSTRMWECVEQHHNHAIQTKKLSTQTETREGNISNLQKHCG